MGYEDMIAASTRSSFSSSHSTFALCCFGKSNSFSDVVAVLQLVQHCKSDMTSEGPFEVVIKLSSHQVGKH